MDSFFESIKNTAALLAGPFRSKADPPPSSTATELDGEVENLTETEMEAEWKAQPSKTQWKLHASFLLDSNSGAFAQFIYILLDSNSDADANLIFRRMIAAQPSENRWKFLAGLVHIEMGEIAESRRLFEQILADDSADLFFESLFENAVLLVRSGEGESAIRPLKKIVEETLAELAPLDGEEKAPRYVRLFTALIQFLKKDVEEAIASYEQLASEDPTDFRPYYCQGVIYSLLGRNEEARDKFTEYHKLKADPPPSSIATELDDEVENLTETEMEAGSKAQPWKTQWRLHASFLLDSNSDAFANLLYSEKNDAGANLIFRSMIAAQPSENRWKFLAALVHIEMGEIAESRRLFEEIHPADSVDLYFESDFLKNILMVRSGEGEYVIRCLKRAAKLAGEENDARDVMLITAQIQFLKKNVEEALASFEQLASEDPKDSRPYYYQGVIYSLLGRNKEARDKFTKYHQLSSWRARIPRISGPITVKG